MLSGRRIGCAPFGPPFGLALHRIKKMRRHVESGIIAHLACLLGLAFASVACTEAGDPYVSPPAVNALEIFDSECATCHSDSLASGGLNLQPLPDEVPCGANGAAIIPGDPDGSLLVQKLTCGPDCPDVPGDQMPLGGSLSPEQIEAIRTFVAETAMGMPDACP